MSATTVRPAAADEAFERLLYKSLSGPMIVLLGGANVIMQLSRLPVGRGVAQSRVGSGRIDKHPIKRTRTTLSYLAIAMFGTDDERVAFRDEVNRQHRGVRSLPGDDVEYNAFDRELQLWVAACIFIGAEQAFEISSPSMVAEHGDALYRHGARFATTLQVTDDMWPADREAFDAYWRAGVQAIEMDDVTRAYLYDFSGLGFLPRPLAWLFGPTHRLICAGFLPAPFRDELGLAWNERRARVHGILVTVVAFVDRVLPGPLRRFPMNAYLRDTRRRLRTGAPIV